MNDVLKQVESNITSGNAQFAAARFSARPPTTIQKDSMRKDLEAMELLLHYTSLVIQEEVIAISIPYARMDMVRPLFEPSQFTAEECIYAEALVKKFSENFVFGDSRFEDDFQELIRKIRPSIFATPIFFHEDPSTFNITYMESIESSTNMKAQAEVINFLTESFLTNRFINFSTNNPANAVILHFYLHDLIEFLTKTRGAGETVPRIIPQYPTKEFNKFIFSRFDGHLRLMRLMTLDGIELKNITRKGLRDYAQRITERAKTMRTAALKAEATE